jgi:hypothetical protein
MSESRYEKCSECGMWINIHNSDYVVVDENGKLHYLHSLICQNRWFDTHHGTVIKEFRHGNNVFTYTPEMAYLPQS